jgi:hypothetical protein
MDKRHQDIQSRHTEGTGNWLIETPEFRSWCDHQALEEPHALLGFGEPGAGKTFALYVSFVKILTSTYGSKARFLSNIYCKPLIEADSRSSMSTATTAKGQAECLEHDRRASQATLSPVLLHT